MNILTIPEALSAEFATVQALWTLDAKTRRVDALILTWVKLEKQARRFFSFLVLQNPDFDEATCQAVIAAIGDNRDLMPSSLLRGIEALAERTMENLMGAAHARLWPEVRRIQRYRNKIFHGQLTGQQLTGAQLEADVRHMIDWIAALADVGTRVFGYDGLERNTRRLARQRPPQIGRYPFRTAADFEVWLTRLTRR
jgi:hypothetical protein